MLLMLLLLIHLSFCPHIICVAGEVEGGSLLWAPLRFAVFILASIAESFLDPSSSGIEASQDRVWRSHMSEGTALVMIKSALRGSTEVNILSV